MNRKIILDPGIAERLRLADTLYDLALNHYGDATEIIAEGAKRHKVSVYLASQIFWELVARHKIGEDVARGWQT